MIFVLHFMPFMMKLLVQHMGDTFLTLTKFCLSYQTYHFEIVPFSMIERSVSILFTTGKLSENKRVRLTIEISGFCKFHGFSYQYNSL